MVGPTTKPTTANGGVAVVPDDDISGEGSQCSNHPFRTASPGGGICAFCLQDKLGKLVSSSSSSFFLTTTTSTSSPTSSTSTSTSLPSFSLSLRPVLPDDDVTPGPHHSHFHHSTRPRLPFLVLKKSKSTRSGNLTPRRRGFWSFLKKPDRPKPRPTPTPGPGPTPGPPVEYVVVDEPNTASFGRKVSRSRSVGCGSRSFSGDFFERISTGFGDCTLRRVESHREGRRSTCSARASTGDVIKERVRCGGLFSGFMITSSSSSSSSSSYWASIDQNINGRPNGPSSTPGVGVGVGVGVGPLAHGRSRSWGWAFASPMRAFTKPNSFATTIKHGNKDLSNGGNASKDSNGTSKNVPSLLAVKG